MKRYMFLIVFIIVLLFAIPAFASELQQNLSTSYATGRSQQDEYNMFTYARDDIIDLEQMDIVFTPADFILLNPGNGYIAPITASTAPGYEIDNLIPAIVWADGETTPATVTFRVPTGFDYGMTLYAFVDESTGDATPCRIDWSIYTNRTGVIFDSATSNQTPVAMSYDAGTPQIVTLTTDTDFAGIVAGDIVTVNIWRDNTAGIGTGDLELYYLGARRTR